jgi:toxin-antitoxin system PIN domain toxin
MQIPDVNVYIYAFREEMPNHEAYRGWLAARLNGIEPFGTSSVALSGFLRLVTNPRVFRDPSPLDRALAFADAVHTAPGSVPVEPGAAHWGIFTGFCRVAQARGGLIPDAWFAALAVEHGCEWVTADRDYSRFPGLRLRHPLDG